MQSWFLEESPELCGPMATTFKKQEYIRIFVDLYYLNKDIQREIYPIVSMDCILTEFLNAKVFNIIDANAGFWQIMMHPEFSALTTFIAPFARFKSKQLPFGIRSAPEVFQKSIRECLKCLNGVVRLMYEFVAYG
ncbi:hypothetical protein AVEN_258621-1 [Araneus ventricosus]|uniref:Reverse transcriptase domain-containing protein n=1 Tax=Araneus ventricosus TaxID=182803 RepID=A0A4Y2QQA7_ARAVE|nr:hypothetical protein AVEN_245760-1 [Araneus ventricosus]GBN65579.1 hypothetical protein AVEN_258621-1 [Araneus ventricosus]